MIIKVLAENTSISSKIGSEHGLSVHINRNGKNILFDTGSTSLFIENAKKMDTDISDVDVVVISHGHNDHGGGLSAFLNLNKKASVYILSKAFLPHYSKKENGLIVDIGLDKEMISNDRIIPVHEFQIIDKGITLFSNVKKRRKCPRGNNNLLMEIESMNAQDDFMHEQNMIISEKDKEVLFTGCAHNGILNILDHYHDLFDKYPDHVIGGFHLSSSGIVSNEEILDIEEIGYYLKMTKAGYYTCHCTGIYAYKRLKEILGRKINYIKGGTKLMI